MLEALKNEVHMERARSEFLQTSMFKMLTGREQKLLVRDFRKGRSASNSMLSSLLYDVSNTDVLDAEKVYPMHSVDALKKGERRQIKRGVNSILRNLRLGFDAFPRPESRVYASDKGIRQRRKRRRRRHKSRQRDIGQRGGLRSHNESMRHRDEEQTQEQEQDQEEGEEEDVHPVNAESRFADREDFSSGRARRKSSKRRRGRTRKNKTPQLPTFERSSRKKFPQIYGSHLTNFEYARAQEWDFEPGYNRPWDSNSQDYTPLECAGSDDYFLQPDPRYRVKYA